MFIRKMDEKFQELQAAGRNGIDSLMQWIKESKIIDSSKEAEEKALKLFNEVNDKKNIELEKFKEIVSKLAAQEKKSAEQMTQMLVEAIPRLPDALANAATAFQDTLTKK